MGLFKKIKKAAKGLVGAAAPIVGGMLGGPLGAAAGSAISGALGSKGAKRAGAASAGGHMASAEEQRNALMRVGGIQQPYMNAGTDGLNALTRLNAGDRTGFMNSPDYMYARDEALTGVENSAAARGGLFSGNTGRRLAEVAGGLASQNLGNYRNALMGQIGVGQGAANTLTGATLGTAAGVGSDLSGAGDARASGIVGSTNAVTGAVEDIAGIAGDYLGNRLLKKQKPPTGATPKIRRQSTLVPY
jgi:hypothetical protein